MVEAYQMLEDIEAVIEHEAKMWQAYTAILTFLHDSAKSGAVIVPEEVLSKLHYFENSLAMTERLNSVLEYLKMFLGNEQSKKGGK